MENSVYQAVVADALEAKAQEESIQYLAYHLGQFLRVREHVFICFQNHEPGSLGWLMEQAVLRCDGIPHVWSQDRRWKTLLREVFTTHSTTIIGAPLLLLGLTKLKKAFKTPLYIRKVVSAGYPAMPWMLEGLVKGFDCEVGGCYSLGTTGVVAGFACGRSWGIHLREDRYHVQVVNKEGLELPAGELGELVLSPKDKPHLRYATGEVGRLLLEPCKCGCGAPRIMDFAPYRTVDGELLRLGEYLQSWTSVLDCHLERTDCGLVIELVTFPGEKLPKLPTAARLDIHDLDMEKDRPFWYDPSQLIATVDKEKD